MTTEREAGRVKITPRQVEILVALKDGRWQGTHSVGVSADSLDRLEARGLLESKTGMGITAAHRVWRLTERGRVVVQVLLGGMPWRPKS